MYLYQIYTYTYNQSGSYLKMLITGFNEQVIKLHKQFNLFSTLYYIIFRVDMFDLGFFV